MIEPGHAFQDDVDGFLGRTLDVGILDTQDEVALHAAGERPRIKRGADVAEVDEAGRTRCEAGADALCHGSGKQKGPRTDARGRMSGNAALYALPTISAVESFMLPPV
jgi:hypothetical protein